MKLLLDQNLSPRLVRRLADLFPDSTHVMDVGLDRALDREVWDYARQHDYLITTKDVDFSEFSILRGFPPKVIWIRRGNCSTLDIEKLPKGVYLATSDNIPGLVAQGSTITETLEIARDVARKLLEAQNERNNKQASITPDEFLNA